VVKERLVLVNFASKTALKGNRKYPYRNCITRLTRLKTKRVSVDSLTF